MSEEKRIKVPYLCGGTFLTLLTVRKKKSTETGRELANYSVLGGLAKVIGCETFMTFQDNSAVTGTSNYRKCIKKAPGTLFIEDEDTIKKFNNRIQDNYSDALADMEWFCNKYISCDNDNPWLIKALLETIKDDGMIENNQMFFSNPDGSAITKEIMIKQTDIYLPSFLLGIWHFIVTERRDNTLGQSTFVYWTEEAATQNCEREVKIDIIGNSIKQKINVVDNIEDEEEEMDPDVLSGKVAPEITIENLDKIFLLDPKHIYTKTISDTFDPYLNWILDKYATKKTLLYEQPEPFYDFFVCNYIRKRITRSDELGNPYYYQFIRNANIEEIKKYSNFVFLEGTGGIGKSMMMQHLLLDATKNYKTYGRLPVLLQLKKYSSETYFIDWALEYIWNQRVDITKDEFTQMLIEGKVVFLMDGMDEIKFQYKLDFENDLEGFVDSYGKCQFIISTRSYENLLSFPRFMVCEVEGFSRDQALELVSKLRFRTDEPSIKQGFLEDLKTDLWLRHNDFIKNPLLLTIMLMTYERFADIPEKIHIFYREAYETLAVKHDATKGVASDRQMKTKLDADHFMEYLAEFSARTYKEELYEFKIEDIKRVLGEMNIVAREKPSFSYKDFVDDLMKNLCLLYEEGDTLHWTHRSFQEYFCAYYLSKQKDKYLNRIGTQIFGVKRKYGSHDLAFGLFYDMIPDRVEEYILLPYLESLFADCDDISEYETDDDIKNIEFLSYFSRELSYWKFLSRMYTEITYVEGEVQDVHENHPYEFFYNFIIRKYGIEECREDMPLPFDSDLAFTKYGYVNKTMFDKEEEEDWELEDIDEIDDIYLSNFGEPEAVGWVMAVNIDTVLEDPDVWEEFVDAIEKEEFPLYKEYIAARKLANEMRARVDNKPADAADDDIFKLF